MPTTIGLPVLLLMLTAQEVNSHGLIQTGREKTRPLMAAGVKTAAQALVWPEAETGHCWLPPNRRNRLTLKVPLTQPHRKDTAKC